MRHAGIRIARLSRTSALRAKSSKPSVRRSTAPVVSLPRTARSRAGSVRAPCCCRGSFQPCLHTVGLPLTACSLRARRWDAAVRMKCARRCGEPATPIVVIGDRDAERPDFWRGLDVTRVANLRQGLDLARVVALPAFVENRPRRLLHALAAGARVIATATCGLAPASNLTIVPAGNADALTEAL